MPDSPIVVAYVIGSMGNGRAGTERSLLTIIENLNRRRFTPLLISLQDCEYVRAGQFACETHCLHLNRMFTPRMWRCERFLARLLRERQARVVQTFFTEGHLVGGRAAQLAEIPAVISSRRNLGYGYGWKERLFLRYANRYPTRWLANSEAVADAISGIEKIDRSSFDVIYNGVPILPLPAKEGKTPFTIAMVANLRPVKSIGTFVEAASVVHRDFPDSRFVVIGEGSERAALEARIRDLELAAVFSLPGSRNDVHDALVQASIGVLASSSEGFSNSILEYMRAGLPVVATDVGGNREVVEDTKNGFLIPVGDSRRMAEILVRLLRDSQLRQALGENARRTFEARFSVSAMIENHQAYYQRLLGSP